MPLLGPDDVLPRRPRRVLVAGTSGSGKSTLAAQIAAVLGVPHIEIDSLFHGPGWTRRETFEADVDRLTAAPGWAAEWQYPTVRELLVDRADLMCFLDVPRRVVMRQVIRRTVGRRMRREVLWNGNVEPPLRTFLTDRDHIVRWAWSTHHEHAARVAGALQRRPDLVVVRLNSHAAAERWLRTALARSSVRR